MNAKSSTSLAERINTHINITFRRIQSVKIPKCESKGWHIKAKTHWNLNSFIPANYLNIPFGTHETIYHKISKSINSLKIL